MTNRLDLLCKIKDAISMPVVLSDRTRTMVMKIGHVARPDMNLITTLYVPNLTCNILYVCQLIHELNCQITFPN